jgi:heme exporter protein A
MGFDTIPALSRFYFFAPSASYGMILSTLILWVSITLSVEFKVENLSCIRQDRCLFEDVGFCLNAGDILQVEGPNGAGKSSLLRILAGFISPSNGQRLWQQKPLGQNNEAFNADILFLGHKAAINDHMSAVENVDYWVQTHATNDAFETVDLLGRLGLVGLEDLPVIQLSAGQQRKVALARLWLSSARIWILDEPFTAIDVNGVAGLQVKFGQHLETGGIIILTTHQSLTEHYQTLKSIRLEYRF